MRKTIVFVTHDIDEAILIGDRIAILREGGQLVQVDTPEQNLESYFLQVVEKAKESAGTSGALAGGRVAAYLRGDAQEPTPDKILERLTSAPEPQKPPAPPPEPEPALDAAKLRALTQPGPPAPTSTPEPAPAIDEKKQANLASANEKLSSLLGKSKP